MSESTPMRTTGPTVFTYLHNINHIRRLDVELFGLNFKKESDRALLESVGLQVKESIQVRTSVGVHFR